jgi:hypothetical protein
VQSTDWDHSFGQLSSVSLPVLAKYLQQKEKIESLFQTSIFAGTGTAFNLI